MTGSVYKDDFAAVFLDVVSTDVLCDAARFASGDIGLPDCIEQRCFAVIDVAHDGDDRRAPHQILGVLSELDILRAFFFVADLIGRSAEFTRQFFRQLYVECLVDSGEHLLLNELFDDQVSFDAELLRKLLNRDAFRYCDFTINGRWLRQSRTLRNAFAQNSFDFFSLTHALATDRLSLMTALLFCGQRGGFGS